MTLLKQILYLAICIYHEARGESAKGQVAVGHVIMNRVQSRDKSVEDIVLQPYQFSWANNNKRPPISNYGSLAKCYDSAMVCLEERLNGQDLHGADHYFAEYIEMPYWAKDMVQVEKIGQHIFYRSS